MKTKIVNLCSAVAVSAGLLSGQALLASDYSTTLAGASVLELPAKAASLVATSADHKATAEAVVRAAVSLQPTCTTAIVGAVARASHDSASAAAVAAASVQPSQVAAIVKATTAAAPDQASKVVAALIRAYPSQYGAIAVAASEASPQQARQILSAVADSVPVLQGSISSSEAAYAANNQMLPVRAILVQSYNSALTSGAVTTPASSTVASTVSPAATGFQPTQTGTVIAPPTVGPPFALFPGSVTDFGPGNTTPQVPGGGGRPYASP